MMLFPSGCAPLAPMIKFCADKVAGLQKFADVYQIQRKRFLEEDADDLLEKLKDSPEQIF